MILRGLCGGYLAACGGFFGVPRESCPAICLVFLQALCDLDLRACFILSELCYLSWPLLSYLHLSVVMLTLRCAAEELKTTWRQLTAEVCMPSN